jgi:hypothetical protein
MQSKREQAINKFANETCENEEIARYVFGEGYDAGYAAALSENAWVAVSERTPQPGKYWVTYEFENGNRGVDWMMFSAELGWYSSTKIIAWMPYVEPEAYTPQEKKNAK